MSSSDYTDIPKIISTMLAGFKLVYDQNQKLVMPANSRSQAKQTATDAIQAAVRDFISNMGATLNKAPLDFKEAPCLSLGSELGPLQKKLTEILVNYNKDMIQELSQPNATGGAKKRAALRKKPKTK
jgi:hypothetical protein